MSNSTTPPIPASILIIGSGVFGLSTAYSLALHPLYKDSTITLIDRSPFPAPDGASIDTSRIVRADYADIAYARLMGEAHERWRNEWWGEGVYHEVGLALVVNATANAETLAEEGQSYMERSLANVRRLGLKTGSRDDGGDVQLLHSRRDIRGVFNNGGGGAGEQDADGSPVGFGDYGYVNWRSGWADAELGMRKLRHKVEETGRVHFVTAEARRLLFAPSSSGRDSVQGAELVSGDCIHAEQTILAAGAWTPALLDLRGVTSATGQVLAYLDITAEEQETLGANPTLLNESNGLFIIPPQKQVLKVARHGYGYANPTSIANPETPATAPLRNPESENITCSLPRTRCDYPDMDIPDEGLAECRAFLAAAIPSLAERPFTHTRLCWYTDTRSGDWIVCHHPRYKGLFVATGGSGHAYKFLPVVGDKIVECLLGKTPEDFRDKWAWPQKEMADQVWTEDWRGGVRGMVLDEELRKEIKV